MKVLKTIRNAMFSAVVLAVALVVAGLAYSLVGQRPYVAPKLAARADQQAGALTPVTPSPNAPEEAAIEALSGSVKPGDVVTVIAQTNAGSTCKISVDKFVATSSQAALKEQVADPYGSVAWSWRADANASAGKRLVTITCQYHGRTGVVQGNFVIQ